MRQLAAWVGTEAPVHSGMHHQPQRLVRASLRSPFGPSADRLTSLEGLGTLGSSDDEDFGMFGVDEEQEAAESDSDWTSLVASIVKAASPVATEVAKGLFTKTKLAQGMSSSEIGKLLGLASQRADAVKSGTASMPTAGWIGIGVGAVALLGLLFFAMGRR
jgi:hypothetical protein